ncbi:MAG: hypothetical protein Hens3KO_04110 [Henriciella sp.]
MSLTIDGREALKAMLDKPDLFSRIKPSDYASVAAKLAKKQVIAGGLNREDQITLRDTLGEDVYEKTLDSMSAHHAKLLARRLDPNVDALEVSTVTMAIRHIRAILAGQPISVESPVTDQAPPAPSKNKYIGRKSFRTGR